MKLTALFILLSSVVYLPAAEPLTQAGKPRIPIILDTDLGTDIDDVFALALALASPELDVRAVTTVGKQAEDRAWMVCRYLAQTGHRTIPVASGEAPPRSEGIDGQIQYRRHPALIFNRMGRPVKQPAAELMYDLLNADSGSIVLVALGPLTNIAKLLDEYPKCRPWIKRVVIMGGALRVGYNGRPPVETEWNLATDVAAARRVLRSRVPITLIPLDASATVRIERPLREKLFTAHTPVTFQVQALYELWNKETPVLFDPVAVAATFQEDFCKFEDLRIGIDERGITRETKTGTPVRVATSIDRDRFLEWFVKRLVAAGEPVLPKPAGNRVALVDRGNFPTKVHVIEDYDTDIEKRWWLAGKLELKDVPPGGHRACRAVLTQDFDDRQGDLKTMYRAVIFNPVPGPPMGPNTRLTFRYKLTGTDQLRVQLYSLSKGYHRYLSVPGLPTGRWETATVDLTHMLRPDGSGGPLAADERIDDIQFYIDPRGELLIDAIVLYDAAATDERRPFPKRLIFTGWFDTGKQGQEWPGDFEIVAHQPPLKGRYAQSVLNQETKLPWLRVSLRGERRLDATTELSFRSLLKGVDTLRVELRNTKTGWSTGRDLRGLRQAEWTATTVRLDPKAGKDKQEVTVDEVRFLLPAPGELGVDDVLVYTPGEK